MTLSDVIRKTIPHRARITAGVWSINLASHSWPVLKAYLTVLHGKPPSNMGISGGHCYYDYQGRRIIAPQNAAGVFLEIFKDEVYERVWKPKPGDVVIDIGAYVGMFTVKASLAVGPSGRVIAVEPCPENHTMMVRNCKGLTNVIPVQKAIMAQKGTGRLYFSKSAAANSMITQWGTYVDVETVTLDQLVSDLHLPWVNYIKLDAEGAEIDVLKGATETLRRGTRIVIAAYHTTENGEKEIGTLKTMLRGAGYSVTQARGLRSYLNAEKAR